MRCCQTLVSNGTWRELVRRDFALDDRQMERWAAELAESAVAEAGSPANASAVSGISTVAAAVPPSVDSVPVQKVGPLPLALLAPRILPAAAHAGRESEWKRLYASL